MYFIRVKIKTPVYVDFFVSCTLWYADTTTLQLDTVLLHYITTASVGGEVKLLKKVTKRDF